MSQSKFSIVRKIAELLKMGDQGKLDSFVTRVVKSLKRDVSGHEKNLEVILLNHNQKLEDLQDKLEDAKEALENSYLNIDVDRIKTNEEQSVYVDVYLSNIDAKRRAVKNIEEQIKQEKEAFDNTKEETLAKVKALNESIDNLEK